MRLKLLRFSLLLAASAAIANSAFATGLSKDVERKFPSEWCPVPTAFLGTFTSDTGIIKLSFSTTNGYDDTFGFVPFEQKLDNVSIIEEAYFNLESTPHPSCYFDGTVNQMAAADLIGKPEVPYYEQFTPPSGGCPWDETNGASINVAQGWIELGDASGPVEDVSTSVIISGLTPGTVYVVHGDWFAVEFSLPANCTGANICMHVTVEDVPQNCNPLPVEGSTWGAIKALYR